MYSTRFLILIFVAVLIFGCREDSIPNTSFEPVPEPEVGLIKITSPVYSENWFPGTRQTIKWEYEEGISKVNLLLYRKDIRIMTIASNVENTASYKWTVPTSLSFSHHYRIKIVSSAGKSSEDFSDYFFIIGNSD